MMRPCVAVIVALAILGHALEAGATCGSGLRISPHGEHVPIDPHVYVWIPDYALPVEGDEFRVEQGDEVAPTRVAMLGRAPAGTAFRLDISASGPEPIRVYGPGGDEIAYYTIDPAPVVDRAMVVAAWHLVDEWSCSYTDAIALEVTGAAIAYRLEWARTAAELAIRPTGRAWLDPGELEFDLVDDLGPDALPPQVLIGYDSCRGSTVPEGALQQPRATRLVALFADGREAAIDTGVMQYSHGLVRLPEQGLLTRFAPPPAIERGPVVIAVASPWRSLGLAALLGVAVALLLVVAVRLPRRMRALLVALAAIAAVGGGAWRAAAACGSLPRGSPAPGARVPPHPRVYLFIDAEQWSTRDSWLSIGQRDWDVPYRATVLGQVGDTLAIRVDIETREPGPLEIRYAGTERHGAHGREYVITYDVDPAVRDDTAALVGQTRIVDLWRAAPTDAIALELTGNAVAYRLEWASVGTSPPGRAWLWPDPADPDLGDAAVPAMATAEVRIGRDGCRGWTIPEGTFAAPRPTRLVALFADGREVAIDTGRLHLDPDATVAAPDMPAAAARPVIIEVAPPWSALIAAAVSGACAALGAVLALRSRRRRGPIGTLGT
ncbi:MAG: hypothetical protein K8W52_02670 [Deltaproteobacteria bacterium]|nr:hypothetical protein [Deltaproteobacteria bacterium]